MRVLVEGVAPGLDKDSSRPPPSSQPPAHQPGSSIHLPPPTFPSGPAQPRYIQPINPLGIGNRDLDPFSTSPALIDPGFAGAGGMIVGPDHPMFQGGVGPEYPDGQGIPYGSVPPGARFGIYEMINCRSCWTFWAETCFSWSGWR
jgi:proteasome inhibitor subunit 1 (PI31)